ncbi:glycoside hydrolase family 13 protein [Dentipellis sp. KUC8613]|nr:glycoside hydrolase family 13 protein [Dentipellis sp. KUC8613]
MNIFHGFLQRIQSAFGTPRGPNALAGMDLGPKANTENPVMLQFFTWESAHPDMSWWKHLETEIPALAELGITQVWLPPAFKATSKNGQGYDAYDLWDLGEFDQKGTVRTRWGTKDELVQAVKVAKQHGIDIILDAVLNHKMGADATETFSAVPVDPSNRLAELGPPMRIEGWTVFNFPGRGGKYSSMRWNHKHFTGLDWDHQTKTQGVYRIFSDTHPGWSRNVVDELGNYDYLLGADIDHSNPEVQRDLYAWATWVLDTTGATGFRLDAIKHIDRKFLLGWVKHVRSLPGRARSFAVAEFWSANVKLLQSYVQAFQGQVSFFDVPLHDNLHQASKRGPDYDLRNILHATLLKSSPGDAVTFVDNHESQIGQSLESWVDVNFKLQAYALILLRGEGHPCVFYGDLYPNRECYHESVAQGLRILLNARKRFAFGDLKDYFQDRHYIGFARMGDSKHPGCAVVVSNAPKDHAHHPLLGIRMNVGARYAGTIFVSSFKTGGHVEIAPGGWGAFWCEPGSLQVWVPADSTTAS